MMDKLAMWLAANPFNITANDIQLPKSTTDVSDIFSNIVQVIMGLVGMIAIIAIIYGGITYSYSRGDAKRTMQARETILYAAVGLVLAIAGLAIVTFITTYIK